MQVKLSGVTKQDALLNDLAHFFFLSLYFLYEDDFFRFRIGLDICQIPQAIMAS